MLAKEFMKHTTLRGGAHTVTAEDDEERVRD
jgi:hypothetical protein